MTSKQVPSLQEQLDIAHERIHQLETILRGKASDYPFTINHLSPIERRLLAILWRNKPNTVHHNILWDALYSGKDNPPESAIVKVHATNLRKRLLGTGYTIGSSYGTGYYICEGNSSAGVTRSATVLWTAEEDAILKESPNITEAMAQLPGRTYAAIYQRGRRTGLPIWGKAHSGRGRHKKWDRNLPRPNL